MDKYKGKKILVVNVASKCGYTPQYVGLQKLHEIYQEKYFDPKKLEPRFMQN